MIAPFYVPTQGFLRPGAHFIFETWWSLCLLAGKGETFSRIKPIRAAAPPVYVTFMDTPFVSFTSLCFRLCFISPNTSSLVSCFCHCFYSLSWHFSQGFISHCLFQLLKFLSPACWGFGCIWEMIRILRTTGGSSRFPSPFLFGDSGDVRVLSFLGGQPAAAGLGLSLEFWSGCPKPDEMLGPRVLLYL